MEVIDLYCCSGGVSEGLRQAGHEIILAVDRWPVALQSHLMNHLDCDHWTRNVMDVVAGELPRAGIIAASPPCMSFSNAATLNRTRDFRDEPLLKYTYNLMRLSGAKYFILENVVLAPFDGVILNAYDFGVPQWRRHKFLTNFELPSSPNGNKRNRISTDISPKILASEFNGGVIDRRKRFMKWFVEHHGRKPEIADAKRYMGFPDDYILCGSKMQQARQLGNAVPPPMMKAIGEAINRLERGDDQV